MSFVKFLVWVAKILIGYGLGLVLMFGGIMVYGTENNVFGLLFAAIGFILLLYGVYNERQHRQPARV